MAFVIIGDILDRAREFEVCLERYYAAIRDESKNQGVRLLTYYLSRHRRHLEQAVKDLDQGTIENINKVRLKYDIDFNPEKAFHAMSTAPQDIKGKELLEAAVEYDQALISLYQKIIEHPLSAEANVFIETLIRLEEKDIVMLKKMIAMDYF